MRPLARTCQHLPLPRDGWVRPVSAVARGKPAVACCIGTSSGTRTRASQPTPTGPLMNTASTTALQALSPAPRRSIACITSLTPSRAASGSWHSNKEAPSRRHVSLWAGGGRNQRASPQEGTGGSSPEGDAALLRRQGREEEVLAALSAVVEPCTGKGVVTLGLVQDLQIAYAENPFSSGKQTTDNTKTADADGGGGEAGEGGDVAAAAVTFTLRVPTLALPGRADLAAECEAAVHALPWVALASARTKARRPRWKRTLQRQQQQQQQQSQRSSLLRGVVSAAGGGGGGGGSPSPGLESVRDVVCVSSCKGGVGKSTVAVNLAYSLAAKGAKVGLLDADVYGPSLPTLVNPEDVALRVSPAFPDLNLLSPVVHRNVKCMSFGWVNAKAGVPGAGGHGAAVMRGPMVSKVINQLLLGTDWGELEYLIIDMPPGTGDIQITLGQALQMSGAVVVTTPQKLSYVDVVKGIDMFAEIKVPVLSVVENMAYFDCVHGERHRPFGPGHARQLVEECGLAPGCVFSLPLSAAVARGSDCGDPVSLSDPEGEEAKVYLSLADAVVREAYRAGETTAVVPEVSFKPAQGIVLRYISEAEAAEFVIPPFELRTRDPATGEPLSGEQAAAVSEDVKPVSVSVRGNYAVSISWSDGHRGAIYSYQVLRKVAEQQQQLY